MQAEFGEAGVRFMMRTDTLQKFRGEVKRIYFWYFFWENVLDSNFKILINSFESFPKSHKFVFWDFSQIIVNFCFSYLQISPSSSKNINL